MLRHVPHQRPDLLPTGMPEGVLVAPSVALLGVDVASDAATARIDVLYGNFKHRPEVNGEGSRRVRRDAQRKLIPTQWLTVASN